MQIEVGSTEHKLETRPRLVESEFDAGDVDLISNDDSVRRR